MIISVVTESGIIMNKNEQSVKILVVEDDLQYQRFLGEALMHMGYIPHLATTGWEGLKDCQNQQPRLVLTDIFMPYLDGVKFIELVRQSNFYIPIIAMTGGMSGNNKEHTLQSAWLRGADATLAKPIDLDLLETTIENLLRTYSDMREANKNLVAGKDVTDKNTLDNNLVIGDQADE